MSNNTKKPSFLGGAAILAAAVAIVKVIGAFYKLPLNNILGGQGRTYFNTSYYIYNVLLTISTAGLPLAISKLTSEAHAKGLENEKRKIFTTAIWLFFLLGTVGSCFMFFGARTLATFLNNPMATQPVRALAPAVFCVCLLACMRGYTQGQGNMTPTAISQVLEAFCKLGIGLPLAWYLIHIGKSLDLGAAGAILGVTVGTILSMCFLIVYLTRHKEPALGTDTPSSRAVILKKILAIGVPITLSNSAMSIINLIDTKVVMGRLQHALGLTEVMASTLNGQYGLAMDMPNMVASFVYPITMSLIPFTAAALAKGDAREANRTVSTAFRVIALLALPAGVGLSALSTPIMQLVLPAQPMDALAAGPHLRILGLACVFICLMILTNAILQSYGKELYPIFTVVIGGFVKVVMNYLLIGNPKIGINGAPVSTLLCYTTIVVLNLILIFIFSPEKPSYPQIFLKPIIASATMGVSAWGVHKVVYTILSSSHGAYGSNALATLFGIGGGVVVYGILVIALRILRADDVQNLPKGAKLAKILHLK